MMSAAMQFLNIVHLQTEIDVTQFRRQALDAEMAAMFAVRDPYLWEMPATSREERHRIEASELPHNWAIRGCHEPYCADIRSMCLGFCCLAYGQASSSSVISSPSIVAVPDDSGTSAAKIGRPETSLDPDGVFPDLPPCPIPRRP